MFSFTCIYTLFSELIFIKVKYCVEYCLYNLSACDYCFDECLQVYFLKIILSQRVVNGYLFDLITLASFVKCEYQRVVSLVVF